MLTTTTPDRAAQLITAHMTEAKRLRAASALPNRPNWQRREAIAKARREEDEAANICVLAVRGRVAYVGLRMLAESTLATLEGARPGITNRAVSRMLTLACD